MGFEIRTKRKYVKAQEFVKEIKKMYKEMKAVLKKSQKEMKKYIDRNRKEAVEYKVEDRMLLSTKDLTQQMKKLTEKFVEQQLI